MDHWSDYPASIVAGQERLGGAGDAISSIDPYNGKLHWNSAGSKADDVEAAVYEARKAYPAWAKRSHNERAQYIKNFTSLVEQHKNELAQLVSEEAGKPIWESKIEVSSLINKFTATQEAYAKRCETTERSVRGLTSYTRFKPHGAVVVLGPFNFPLSMSNGHIMPALYAGNTVVYKPSELTSLCGIYVARLWQKSGLPSGVLNCVTGSAATGKALIENKDINGVFFVGSHRGGLAILQTLANRPDKIVALEMGGNSPLVIHDFPDDKLNEVIGVIIQSAFVSAGQRCSAARRLLVHEAVYGRTIDALKSACSKLELGDFRQSPEPFYGPLIRPGAASSAFGAFGNLVDLGGRSLLSPHLSGPITSVMRPGLVNVDLIDNPPDEEIFGPVLQISTYSSVTEAISLSNKTKYGLAAGIVCKERNTFEEFLYSVDAGIINWNQQLTGATTFAPFGGIKQSGNFRPAGFLSADYCSHAVASFEVDPQEIQMPSPPGITF
jgi:succinylglutamic semialdehyde dehydrogenase